MVEQTPEELAQAAAKRGTFNLAMTVLDRAYPEIPVTIYLNEKAAQRLLAIRDELVDHDIMIAGAQGARKKQLIAEQDKLVAEQNELAQEVAASAMTFTVRGVSSEVFEQIDEDSLEKFPIEYDESTSPITGAVTKVERRNPDRDKYTNFRLRHEHIASIENAAGDVAEPMSLDEFSATWMRLPVAARNLIDLAIRDCTVSAEAYKDLVDEVFSQRP